MLARVDGKSPVEYLTSDADKDVVRAVAEPLLLAPVERLAEVARAWAAALDSRGAAMCDTLTALAGASAGGAALFAKNSDRERNEAQGLEMVPRADHAPGAMSEATYIAIPRPPRTHACLLSRPYWMWGAEMGANEHGLVIGNEAMHATVPAQRRRALTGMDLVRLGLERAASAAEAVEVITGLLERHGQGGDCGHLGRFYYHNGFIIADPREAYVLETVGRWWVVEKVTGLRALSNALSVGDGYDRASDALLAHARAEGWTDAAGRFDFAGRLIDEARDAVSFGRGRCARGTELLERRRGTLGVGEMMADPARPRPGGRGPGRLDPGRHPAAHHLHARRRGRPAQPERWLDGLGAAARRGRALADRDLGPVPEPVQTGAVRDRPAGCRTAALGCL